jgi:heme O synthase-like polyprenyltransferase
MMSVLDPAMNARVSMRYSLLLFPISLGFYYYGLCSPWFLLDSSLINGYMAFYAFRFYKKCNDANARALFFSSLIHLPLFLILLMVYKTSSVEDDGDDHESLCPEKLQFDLESVKRIYAMVFGKKSGSGD